MDGCIISRPGRSQGLLYILSFKENQKCIIGSTATAILLEGCILPIAGEASGRVCDQRGYPVYLGYNNVNVRPPHLIPAMIR